MSSLSSCSDDRMQFSSSQPDFAAGGWEAMLLIGPADGQVSLSQPIKPEHMLLGTQMVSTPGASQVTHRLDAAWMCSHICIYRWVYPGSINFMLLVKFCFWFEVFKLCFPLWEKSPWQKLVRRMTRFFTSVNADASLSALKEVCDGMAFAFKLTCTKQVSLCPRTVNGSLASAHWVSVCPEGDREHEGQTQQQTHL